MSEPTTPSAPAAHDLAHTLAFTQATQPHPSQLSEGQAAERPAAFPFHGTHIHRARLVTVDSEVPTWFWLTFLALGALALSLVCWGAYRSLSEEKFLRVADKPSTLGLTGMQVASGRIGDPEPVRLALKEEPLVPPPPFPVETPPPPLPKVEPTQDLLLRPVPKVDAGIELPPLVPAPPPPLDVTRPVVNLEAFKEVDSNPLCYTRALPTEDTPMLRNWKMLALYSLTVVTFAQPVPVVAGDQKTLLDRFEKLEQSIVKSFENLGSDIKSLNNDLAHFKKELTKAQGEIGALQTESLDNKLKINGFGGKLDSLEKQVQKIGADLDALHRRLDSEPRSTPPLIDKAAVEEVRLKLGAIEKAILSLQPTKERVALSPGVTTTTGRVMLVNNYPETLLFIINSREFRVPGMTTQPIDGVPAGNLEYEVISPTWGSRARRTTSLSNGETFTLTAQ